MHLDEQACLRAIRARDPRFDGWFVIGVRSTGIYCRPSCPAVLPRVENICFLPDAAAAQQHGFRACKRCRPDAAPGSPQWDLRADLTARAMRLIADGVVDAEGVQGLADRLGYSTRQVQRQLLAELGAGPLELARAQRARTARLLVETTDLAMAEVAFAAGFASVRSFNDTVRSVFAMTPTALRAAAGTGRRSAGGGGRRAVAPTAGPGEAQRIRVRLPFRAPLLPDNVFGHLAATAVPGVEEWREGAYRCALRGPHGVVVAALRPAGDHVDCLLALTDLRDLSAAVSRCRRLLDLDADPVAVDAALAEDPVLAPLVTAAPGRRVPRTADPAAFAIRAVLGQQVSTAAARTTAGRLAGAHGEPVHDPHGGLSRLFPDPAVLAELDPAGLGMPRARARAVQAVAGALATGELDLSPGCDRDETRARLLALPGIGPWTADTVAMRALGDPDAFPVTDLGVVLAARRLGLPDSPAALSARSAAWRPWRAYAVQHLWATGDHAVNQLPGVTPPGTTPVSRERAPAAVRRRAG